MAIPKISPNPPSTELRDLLLSRIEEYFRYFSSRNACYRDLRPFLRCLSSDEAVFPLMSMKEKKDFIDKLTASIPSLAEDSDDVWRSIIYYY